MSKPSIEQHEARFDGWPTLRQAVGAQMPERDGDIAALEELQERVFDALADLPWPATASCAIEATGNDALYQILVNDAGFPFAFGFKYWPDDRAAEQIALWRFEIDHAGPTE